MADRLILPPPEAMRRMIEDLYNIAQVPTEQIRQISEHIAHQTGFLRDANLEALIDDVVENEEARTPIFNALQNLDSSTLDLVVETVQRWRQSNQRIQERFSDSLFASLREKLGILIQKYPALDRMQKAERLRHALGNELQGAVFICDARPVYDELREQIEGMLPVTTLKLVYERQDQSTEEIELIVSAEQLSNLLTQAQKAQQKLQVLRNRIADWLPDGCVDPED